MRPTTRLRAILPLPAACAFLLLFLGTEYPRIKFWWYGVDFPNFGTMLPAAFVLQLGACAYGAYRALAFHPIYRPGYQAWLGRTPWTGAKGLPLGPASLFWKDGFALAGLSILSYWEPTSRGPLKLLTLLLLSNSLFLAATLRGTGVRGFGSAVVLLAGLSVRLTPDLWLSLLAAALAYSTAYTGLKRSLARFPWPTDDTQTQFQIFKKTDDRSGAGRLECGWPYDALRPPPASAAPLSTRDTVALAIIAGWWLFAMQGLFADPREASFFASLIFAGVCLFLTVVRFVIYRVGYAPPINALTRLLTGRLIIPSYDQIYIGPVLTLLVGWLFYLVPRSYQIDPGLSCPVGLALLIVIALKTPPGLIRWKLTGGHRIVFPSMKSQDHQRFVKAG